MQFTDLCQAFADLLPVRLEQLRQAHQRHDLAAMRLLAHTLAGSAASFGFARVGRAAAQLERACIGTNTAAIGAALDALHAAGQVCKPPPSPKEPS